MIITVLGSMWSGIWEIMQTRRQIEIGVLSSSAIASHLKLQTRERQAELHQTANRYSATLKYYVKPGSKKYPFPSYQYWGWSFHIYTTVSYGGIEQPKVIKEIIPESNDKLTLEFTASHLDRIIVELEHASRTMAEALRNQARLYRIEGNDIHFVTSEWMKARFEKPLPRTAIQEAFGKVLGQTVSVYFVPENSVSVTELPKSDDRILNEQISLIEMAEALGGKIVK